MVQQEEFERHLKRAFQSTQTIMREEGTTAYRWYDWSLEEIALSIDMYGSYVCIIDRGMNYRVLPKETLRAMVARVVDLPVQHVFWMQEKQPGKFLPVQAQEVREHNLAYTIDLRTFPNLSFSIDYNRVRLLLLGATKEQVVLNCTQDMAWSYISQVGGAERVLTLAGSQSLNNGESNQTGTGPELEEQLLQYPHMENQEIVPLAAVERESVGFILTMDKWGDEYIPELQERLRVGGYLFIISQYGDSYPLILQRSYGDLREVTGGLIPPGFSKKRFPRRFWLWQKG